MTFMEHLGALKTKEAQDEALADIQAKADALVEEAGATVGKPDDPDATHTWDAGVLTKIERGVTGTPDPDFVPNVIDPDDPNQVEFGIWLESIGKLDVFINKEKGWSILWDTWRGGDPLTQSEHVPEGGALSILNNMKDGFLNALRGAGMSADMTNQLWEWAVEEFKANPDFTAERALLEMYERPEFKLRFPAIGQMEGAPTPGEYISFEKAVRKEFNRFGAGNPSASTITSLLLNQVGLTEVTDRLSEAERVLFDVPQEVRDTFNDWWGETASKEITMSLFLDPTQDWSDLQDKIETAEVGAWGTMAAGLDQGWNEGMANKISDLGLSQAATWNAFANLKDKELLFAEQVGEDTDLQYETHGVQAEFGIAGDSLELEDMLERRKQRRINRFRGGGTGQAGAIISGQTTGIGSANA